MVDTYDHASRDVLLHKVLINPLLVSVHATRDSRFSLMRLFSGYRSCGDWVL